MKTSHVELSVPAEAAFARTVRMMAANLAVCLDMNVDDVEEVRMAAEEGFVLSCASKPAVCAIAFDLSDDGIAMEFQRRARARAPARIRALRRVRGR